MITAAVDILGGIGADYVKSGKCNNGPAAPFLKLHGMKDPFITYDKQVRNIAVNLHTSDCGLLYVWWSLWGATIGYPEA
jgi:hypothetical protein